MRRCFEVMVMAATLVVLLATSQARYPCAPDTATLRAETTCGPSTELTVALSSTCEVTVTSADAGEWPSSGAVENTVPDAGLGDGFTFRGTTQDAGFRDCWATPSGAGFSVSCTWGSRAPDAGDGPWTGPRCDGTLTPR